MKGYKATYNFKCRNQEYKVGKTYTADMMMMCSYGIHFCQNMKDVINYYYPTKDFILLEIDVLGNVETEDDKSVTDKIKVLRVIPPEEYTFLSYKYDDRGNMISETTPDGDKYTYEYDDRGNMISMTYPDGSKYTFEYDDRNNKISMTYPYGRKYTYEYDDRGNKISETYPNGDNHTYEYDDRGNKISETTPDGDKYTYEYDDRNNMISMTYPSGAKYTYEVAIITESD